VAAISSENARRCDPPLEDREVRQIASSVARYKPVATVVRAVNGRQRVPFSELVPRQDSGWSAS
jgi:hypothetical protein